MAERNRKIHVDKKALLERTTAIITQGDIQKVPPGTFVDASIFFNSGKTPQEFRNAAPSIQPEDYSRPPRFNFERKKPATAPQTPDKTRQIPLGQALDSSQINILQRLSDGEREMDIKGSLGTRSNAAEIFNRLTKTGKKALQIMPGQDALRTMIAVGVKEGLIQTPEPSLYLDSFSKRELNILELLGNGCKPEEIRKAIHATNNEITYIMQMAEKQLGTSTIHALIAKLAAIPFPQE